MKVKINAAGEVRLPFPDEEISASAAKQPEPSRWIWMTQDLDDRLLVFPSSESFFRFVAAEEEEYKKLGICVLDTRDLYCLRQAFGKRRNGGKTYIPSGTLLKAGLTPGCEAEVFIEGGHLVLAAPSDSTE